MFRNCRFNTNVNNQIMLILKRVNENRFIWVAIAERLNGRAQIRHINSKVDIRHIIRSLNTNRGQKLENAHIYVSLYCELRTSSSC